MDIIVCVKRVPDMAEAEVEIDASGTGIRTEDLTFAINEWDRFAVEEAIRLRDAHGGRVTVMTVGDEEAEDVLRRALAMGADAALRLWDEGYEALDAFGVASGLRAAIAEMPHDFVLTGSVSSDGGSGLVGGMLAELLDLPQVALATSVSVTDGTARVQHEVEGGMERIVEVDLPALVSVQTGINEPRYVSIRGIRKVSGVVIPVRTAADLGISPETPRATTLAYSLPPATGAAEILEGRPDEVADQLVERLKQRGGL